MHDDHVTPASVFTWSDALDAIDWRDVETLYRLAPLGNKSAAHLQMVFTNSRFRCFAFDGHQLVAAGRALSDGADCSYVCDVAVLPDYQGHGLGKQVVARLVELSRGHKKIILYAVPGKETFYRKLGFERMLTAMAIFEDQAGAFERGYLSES
jgi:ribosomal protein S18 acetylase RimI-like enzyme